MPEHIIINDETYLYECLNCGFKSEPPWMTPPPDIAQDARDHFFAEHKNCKLFVAESGEGLLSLGRVTKVGEQTGEQN
jgi:hypothetical protein